MKLLKTLTAISVLPLLAACASNWDVDGAKMAANNGSAFQKAMQSEYVMLAKAERDEGDWEDARKFVAKALESTEGVIDPQMVSERRIPEDKVAEMAAAREKLMAAFAAGGREATPEAAARAQAGFDCWMQEQEENFQPEDIAACKKQFEAGYAAMGEKKPMAKMAESVIVYFGFNSAELDDEAKAMVVKASMMGRGAESVMVSGHTDTKGNTDYNESLALTRAQAVSEMLKSHGIPAKSLRVGASGEKVNAVTTGDEVEEARNRRVEITIK